MSDILDTSTALDSRALACQDAVMAVLREADEPLPTPTICALAGPRLTYREHRSYRHLQEHGRLWFLVACFADEVDVIAEVLEVDRWGYQLLMRLERFGYVRRSFEGGVVVWWEVAGRREWDDEVDALDAAAGVWVVS